MPEELMNTKEVAKHLGIHEKQVYALIKAKRIPCTRVTGKWVFPRRLIDEWIENTARSGMAEARKKSKRIEGALLAAGSNDPILDILKTYIRKAYPEFYIFSANTGQHRWAESPEPGVYRHRLVPSPGPQERPVQHPFSVHLSSQPEDRGGQFIQPGPGFPCGSRESPAHSRVQGSHPAQSSVYQPAEGFRHEGAPGPSSERSQDSRLVDQGIRK